MRNIFVTCVSKVTVAEPSMTDYTRRVTKFRALMRGRGAKCEGKDGFQISDLHIL